MGVSGGWSAVVVAGVHVRLRQEVDCGLGFAGGSGGRPTATSAARGPAARGGGGEGMGMDDAVDGGEGGPVVLNSIHRAPMFATAQQPAPALLPVVQ